MKYNRSTMVKLGLRMRGQHLVNNFLYFIIDYISHPIFSYKKSYPSKIFYFGLEFSLNSH